MAQTIEVLPDVSGLDRTFHYVLDESTRGGGPQPLPVGSIVRVPLHGRRVRGFVLGHLSPGGALPPPEIELQPVLEVVSQGPPPAVVELCRWAAWRYAGRLRPLLLAASPPRIVPPGAAGSDPAAVPASPAGVSAAGPVTRLMEEALSAGDAVVRLPPAEERLPAVEAALRLAGGGLVLVESTADRDRLADLLSRAGWAVARYPDSWAEAASSARVVIGTRNAAFAPLTPPLTLVLDAHSSSYRSERVPSFDARVVAAERARRSGRPIVFVTPCPSVELLSAPGRRLVTVPAALEREGWGTIGVLDAREEDPAEGGYPSRLVAWIRQAASEVAAWPSASLAGSPAGSPAGAGGYRPVVCVLNRKGRARLLSCGLCRSIQRCERCGAAQVQLAAGAKGSKGSSSRVGVLNCPRCGPSLDRPAICPSCGSARLQVLRPGVAHAREQLEAVTGLEVGEVSGAKGPLPERPVVIGTEAVLHRLRRASMVVWLDFDQQLLAPRFRASEEALALLARSVRMVGGRLGGSASRVVVRTSLPDHEVLQAAQRGDPGLVYEKERALRELLSLPPCSALARIDGEGADALVERLPPTVTTSKVAEGRHVVRARSSSELADGLALLVGDGPAGWAGVDARVEVDPIDI